MDPVIIVLRIIYVTASVLNSLEIVTIVKSATKWHKNTNLFLLYLASIDLSVGIGGLGIAVLKDICRMNVYGEDRREGVPFRILLSFGRLGSLFATALITLDRYIAVIHPLKFRRWRRKPNVMFAITVTFLISALVVVVHYIHWFIEIKVTDACFQIPVSISTFVVSIIMIVTYWRIFQSINRNRRRACSKKIQQYVSKLSKTKTERRFLYVTCVTTVLFIILTAPESILFGIECGLEKWCGWDLSLWLFSIFLMKSSTDPIIFFIGSPKKKHNTVKHIPLLLLNNNTSRKFHVQKQLKSDSTSVNQSS